MKKTIIIRKIGSKYGVILLSDCTQETYGGPVKFDPDFAIKTGTYYECRKWAEDRKEKLALIKGVK